jgi:hypothetical protein
MISFKQWIYNEGFELPFDSIRQIYDYYLDGYRQYLKSPRTKIEPKIFDLNLQNTKYNFLQYLNPRIKVNLAGSLPQAIGIYHGQYSEVGGSVGKISLSFSDFQNVNYGAIEHEVLHYVQSLIQRHARKRTKNKNPTLGGLPSPSIIKRIMKDRGINVKGEKEEKRTKHEYRPIEYYTNLNSLIRSLQYHYVSLGYKMNKDLEEWAKDSRSKMFFFNSLMSSARSLEKKSKNNPFDTKDTQEFGSKIYELGFDSETEGQNIISDLLKIKKLDESLYKIYIREIYKRFINNNNFVKDAIEVGKITDIGNKLKTEKEKGKQEKKEKQKEKEKTAESLDEKWKTSDFSGRLDLDYEIDNLSNIADSNLFGTNLEIAENMLFSIGIKQNGNNEYFSTSLNYKNLKKIFDKIKELRKEKFQGMPKEIAMCNFDHLAKELSKRISESLREIKRKKTGYWEANAPSQEEILNIFYPGPYGSCETNEYGQFIT